MGSETDGKEVTARVPFVFRLEYEGPGRAGLAVGGSGPGAGKGTWESPSFPQEVQGTGACG